LPGSPSGADVVSSAPFEETELDLGKMLALPLLATRDDDQLRDLWAEHREIAATPR
jgi:hypothetical protein